MKKKDIILIAAALLAALALYMLSQVTLVAPAASLVVTLDGEEILKKPLAVEDSYTIEQEDGSLNVITVEDGAVYMSQANCRDGLCIRQGRMKNAAKTIVCLPHKLVVQLSGEPIAQENSDLDVIIQ